MAHYGWEENSPDRRPILIGSMEIPVLGIRATLTSARKEYIAVKAKACTVRISCLLRTSSRCIIAAVKYPYGASETIAARVTA